MKRFLQKKSFYLRQIYYRFSHIFVNISTFLRESGLIIMKLKLFLCNVCYILLLYFVGVGGNACC